MEEDQAVENRCCMIMRRVSCTVEWASGASGRLTFTDPLTQWAAYLDVRDCGGGEEGPGADQRISDGSGRKNQVTCPHNLTCFAVAQVNTISFKSTPSLSPYHLGKLLFLSIADAQLPRCELADGSHGPRADPGAQAPRRELANRWHKLTPDPVDGRGVLGWRERVEQVVVVSCHVSHVIADIPRYRELSSSGES